MKRREIRIKSFPQSGTRSSYSGYINKYRLFSYESHILVKIVCHPVSLALSINSSLREPMKSFVNFFAGRPESHQFAKISF